MPNATRTQEAARAARRDGRPHDRAALADAALLGAAGGLRTSAPFAALAARGRVGHGAGRWALLSAAAGEVVVDKLPQTPARTSPPALAGRLVCASLAGGRLAGPAGAAAAGASAGLSAFAGERGRRALGARTGVPDPLLGAAEDVLAAGAALVATRRLGRRPAGPRRPSLGPAWRGLAVGVAPTLRA